MKPPYARIAGLLAVVVINGCLPLASYCQSTRIEAQVRVRDSDGRPVEAATVTLAARHYGLGATDQQTSVNTDRDGMAELSVLAQSDYLILVRKAGYYETKGAPRSIDTPTQRKKHASGLQRIDEELRPIRNPIVGITKVVYRLPIPKFNEPVGFDLLTGNWVSPHGKGSVADFVFTLSGYVRSQTDFDLTLLLEFSQVDDGVLVFKAAPNSGSLFKFPYEAPLAGYSSVRKWRNAFDGKNRILDMDLTRETNYIFRVRSQHNENGEIARGLYGIIVDEVEVLGTTEKGFNVTFCYRLNPGFTQNIEFTPPEVPTR